MSRVTPVQENATHLAASAELAGATRVAEQPAERIPLSWPWVIAIVWFAGCGWEAIRLLRLQRDLRLIVRNATAASARVQSLALQIQTELKIARPVSVRVSDSISSPFLCGVLQPMILLPRRMADDLPLAELSALLTHELAHERRSDVAWCISWRVMRALSWFHPLVWQIPEAHVLACEEEADRVAAQRAYEGNGYARVLAQLALRVLRVPAEETPLALNATSHLARRLLRLGADRAATWRATHSLAGFAVAAGLLVLTAGWQFAQNSPAEAPTQPIEMGIVLVTVQDENGRPIEGAIITPNGLRAKEERLRSTGYGWMPDRHGPVLKAVTDQDGNAWVTYPVAIVLAEKILTGEIGFSVDHPDFASMRSTGYPVDGTGKPVLLRRGISLRVSGYFGPSRQRVSDIVPHLIGDLRGVPVRVEEWQREADGSFVFRRMTRGKHFLHVAGRLPSGELVYSDGLAFFGEQRDSHDLVLELKAGVRVEGRVDANVARPIKNGWVQLSVHDDDANTEENRHLLPRSFGNTGFWWSYRPLNSDGTFVFESVPLGELKVIAYGEGFISTNGPEEVQPTPPGVPAQPLRRATRGVPQSFAAVRPISVIEVTTEPAAALQVRVKAGGTPVAGAKIYIWPNVTHMPTGSRIFGSAAVSSEAPFRQLSPLPERSYSSITDRDGIAVLRNVPAFTSNLGVEHSALEVPLREPARDPAVPTRFHGAPNRYIELTLSPGQTTQVDVALQPKGRQFAGNNP